MTPLLLDNNVFHSLTHKRSRGNPGDFIQEVRASRLIAADSRMSLALTPFSLLEAIGIVPSAAKLTFNSIPLEAGSEPDAIEAMVDDLLHQALKYYEQCSEISETYLKAKAREQRNYTHPEALAFFDRCVTDVLETPGTRCHIIACLAVDALFKYAFKHELLPYFHVQFLTMLFSKNAVDNAAGLFRVIKRVWDELFRQMYQEPQSYNRQRLVEANQHMAIKNDRDFLDCDLIHYLCLGYVVDDQRLPVIAFTTDTLDVVATRISVFKAVAEQYRSSALHVTGHSEEESPHWEQGILVHCIPDGRLGKFIRVVDIQPIDSDARHLD